MFKNLFSIILTSYILLNFPSFAEDQSRVKYWISQTTPISTKLLKCSFVDSLYGWACGDSGRIIHTSNGGVSWVLQSTPINYYIEDIQFIDRNTGWAIANEFFFIGTTILSTTNGGQNWDTTRFQDTTVVLSAVHFTDNQNGWLGSYYGKIFKTSNAGQNWIYSPSDSGMFAGFKINKFRFYSDNFGYACGGQIDIAGVMWRTGNGGGLWTTEAVSPEPLYDLKIIDSLSALGVGGDYEYGTFIIKTSNAGINWEYTSLNLFGQGQALAYRTQNEIWIPLGFSQTWAVSFDAGENWSEIGVEQNIAVWDAEFVSPVHGWAVGDSGKVLKFNPDAVNISGNSTIIPNGLALQQNYPNPFNPATKIRFEVSKPEIVRLTIYDINGREIENFDLGRVSPGSHVFTFNGTGYAAGTYFYRLITSSGTETKKMVLLK